MSIQSEIDRINNAKTESFEAAAEKGVTVPEGARIDALPGLIRSIPQEGGGTLVQQQADYNQNDSSKVDFIKNRPFYTEDKYTHEVILGDESIEHSTYKVGDIVPRKDSLYEITIRITGTDESGEQVTFELAGDTRRAITYVENVVDMIFLINDENFAILQCILVYQEAEELPPPGLYVCFDDVSQAKNIEIDVACHKTIEDKYTQNDATVVVDIDDTVMIGTNIPISLSDMFVLMTSVYSPTKVCLYARCKFGEDTVYIPFHNLGLGIFEITAGIKTYVYEYVSGDLELSFVGSRLIIPDTSTEPTATTYGLRQPSLADQITASLEERGLTLSQLRERLPKADLTKLLNKEVTD